MALHKLKNGYSLNYEIIPNVLPETTVFIHGNLASNRWWYPTEQAARRFYRGKANGGAMILVEFLGCGQSSPPQKAEDVNMQVFADEFNELLLFLKRSWAELGLKEQHKFNLVGHSTGGLIAALMLAKNSDLYDRAILLDPVGATGVQFDLAMIGAFEAMKTDKALTAQVMASTIYKNDANSDFFKQIVVEDAFHAVNTVGYWVLQALSGLDIREQMRSIKNQVLVLHGEFDQLLPIEESKNLATLIPNANFETISGQGHCVNAENPDLFTQKLDQFLFQ